MNYKKGNVLVIFIVVLLLISVLAAAYFYLKIQGIQQESFSNAPVSTTISTQSPDLTANWKLFSNSELGISFKYPPNYAPKIEGTTVSISDRKPAGLGLDEGPLDKNELEILIIVTPTSGKTSEELANEIKLSRGLPTTNLQAPLIDGAQSAHLKWADEENNGGEAYVVFHGTKVVTIYKYPITTKHQDNFDQILFSFRFLN